MGVISQEKQGSRFLKLASPESAFKLRSCRRFLSLALMSMELLINSVLVVLDVMLWNGLRLLRELLDPTADRKLDEAYDGVGVAF